MCMVTCRDQYFTLLTYFCGSQGVWHKWHINNENLMTELNWKFLHVFYIPFLLFTKISYNTLLYWGWEWLFCFLFSSYFSCTGSVSFHSDSATCLWLFDLNFSSVCENMKLLWFLSRYFHCYWLPLTHPGRIQLRIKTETRGSAL